MSRSPIVTGVDIIVIASCLLLCAVWTLVVAARANRRIRSLTRVDVLSIADLHSLCQQANATREATTSSKVCWTMGVAQSAPHGALRAPRTGAESVWHGHDDTDHVREATVSGLSAVYRTAKRERRSTSHHHFRLVDHGRAIDVDPSGGWVDQARRVSYEHRERDGMRSTDVGTFANEAREVILRPGEPLSILGEVRHASGHLVIGAPPASRCVPFIMSAGDRERAIATSAADLRPPSWRSLPAACLATIACAALVVVGIVLL